MKRFFTRALLCSSAMIAPLAAAFAQVAPPPPPAPYYTLDRNGVDLATGGLIFELPGISIGPSQGGLSFRETLNTASGFNRSFDSNITVNGSNVSVQFGNVSDRFTLSGGVYVSALGGGSKLVQIDTTHWSYTSASGTVLNFSRATPNVPPVDDPIYLPSQSKSPNGDIITYNWVLAYVQETYPSTCVKAPATLCHRYYYARLTSMTSNRGYQIAFGYADDTTDGSPSNNANAWQFVTAATATNTVTGGTARTVTYSYDGTSTLTATDAAGQMVKLVLDSNPYTQLVVSPVSVRIGVSTVDDYQFGYANGRVATVTRPQGAWTYGYNQSGSLLTTTTTDPTNRQRTTVIDTTMARPTSDTVAGRTTSYLYDSYGRVTRTTAPQGNYTQYTYDARGNVTQADTAPMVPRPRPATRACSATRAASRCPARGWSTCAPARTIRGWGTSPHPIRSGRQAGSTCMAMQAGTQSTE